ncbi:MAG: abortive infection family protein [Lachnospiraceae bacterium]|nr:abortive infection family protein [Lachnospiraceae bacterium]
MDNNLFKLLKTKEIIAILDGDTKSDKRVFEDDSDLLVQMPYLSGPDLCGISTRFGLAREYTWGGTNLSRWQYLDDLMGYCLENNRFPDLLAFLFSKGQFSKMLSGCTAEEINTAYSRICAEVIQMINGILLFGGHELVTIGNSFCVRKCGEKVEVQAPAIKQIDREYIRSITERALQDVDQKNYDSAITKSRTLLEETFCYVIEQMGEKPATSGQISDLYKQVKNLYSMHTDGNTDRRINTLLSGLEKIVSAISEMRNKDSDAHGVGAERVEIADHHARLFVNAALTMADFILSVEKEGFTAAG